MVRPSPLGRTGLYSATRELNIAAKTGDSTAQWWLGFAQLHGHYGIGQNRREAVYWLRKSATQGNGLARAELGKHYQKSHNAANDNGEKNVAKYDMNKAKAAKAAVDAAARMRQAAEKEAVAAEADAAAAADAEAKAKAAAEAEAAAAPPAAEPTAGPEPAAEAEAEAKPAAELEPAPEAEAEPEAAPAT